MRRGDSGLAPAPETRVSQETVSTTNPDYSQEKDMAYYLAKIKAKAALKSQELRYTFLSNFVFVEILII